MKSENIKSLIIIVCFTLGVFVLGYILQRSLGGFHAEHDAYTWNTTTSPYGRYVTRELIRDEEAYSRGEDKYSSYGEIDFDELREINSEIIGWITIGDIYDTSNNIDHPVLQTYNNIFYQNHNIYRDESRIGAIFADCSNTFENGGLSDNTVIYGNNPGSSSLSDGMFYPLENYYNWMLYRRAEEDPLAFYRQFPTVTFETPYEKSVWKIFAVCEMNDDPSLGETYPYNTTEFKDETAFNKFVEDLKQRSFLTTDIDVEYGDKLLTLVTQYYPHGSWNSEELESRLVVCARKVRDGESPDVDTENAAASKEFYDYDGVWSYVDAGYYIHGSR